MRIIHSFTRKEALETGQLMDISHVAKQAGVKFPIAVTQSVWEGVIQPDQIAMDRGESVEGRMWDVSFMFTLYARKTSGDTLYFPVAHTVKGESQISTLKATIGPGDTYAPVITIMYQDED